MFRIEDQCTDYIPAFFFFSSLIVPNSQLSMDSTKCSIFDWAESGCIWEIAQKRGPETRICTPAGCQNQTFKQVKFCNFFFSAPFNRTSNFFTGAEQKDEQIKGLLQIGKWDFALELLFMFQSLNRPNKVYRRGMYMWFKSGNKMSTWPVLTALIIRPVTFLHQFKTSTQHWIIWKRGEKMSLHFQIIEQL